jgi:hypothetical protein
VIDHDFSDASKSPFVGERGKSPRVNPSLKHEKHFGGESFVRFHAPSPSSWRYWIDWPDQGALTNAACRLTGRIKSGDLAAMSLWLGGPAAGNRLALGVQVWNTGELTVEQPPWNEIAFAFPSQKRIRDSAIRPGDQANELLVVIQDRKLRIFVNDKEIGQALQLPEVLFPVRLGTAAWHIGGGQARVQFLRYELWDLDHPMQRSLPRPEKPAKAKLPADLPKLKPVVDHDFSEAGKSPFVYESGKSPKVYPELKSERQWGRETVYLFHARPDRVDRALKDWHSETYNNFACRLTGRVKSGNRSAMILWLGTRPARYCLGVKVWNNGELAVEELPWKKASLVLPMQKRIRDEAIRPGDQANELLVVIQKRQLRTFVNDKEIGQALQLPEVLFPAHLGIAAWHIGEEEARVQFLRYTLWDLDNLQWRRPEEALPLLKPAKPSENEKQPG